ncbi:MAG: hypothetical protein ABI120_04415 [Gemmatimonadaceae bacterium]
MKRTLIVASFVWSLVSMGGEPLSAQSVERQMDSPANARVALPLPARFRLVDVRLLLPMQADTSSVTSRQRVDRMTPVPDAGESHRGRHAIIGGVLGTVVGLGACTAISNLMDDSTQRRVSTCTATGNLIFGAGGMVVGALIGAVIK